MIYFAQIEGLPELVKIGYSRDPVWRARQLSWAVGSTVTILASVPGLMISEGDCHRKFAHLRVGRLPCEYRTAGTEWFRVDDDLRHFIETAAETKRLPLLLHERRHDYIESLLADGLSIAEAGRRIGVSRQTASNIISTLKWVRRFHTRPTQTAA